MNLPDRLIDFLYAVRMTFIYLTFGKSSRLVETLIGAIVIGGASRLGALPEEIEGTVGWVTVGLCVFGICWLGVQTGRSTLSPTLNHTPTAILISIFQILYISFALFIIYTVRKLPTSLQTIVAQETSRVVALVCILTLGYMTIVNRSTKLTEEQRAAQQHLQKLTEMMKNKQKKSAVSHNERQDIMSCLEETANSIPDSKFSDVGNMKNKIMETYNSLEELDPDSAAEVMSGEYLSEEKRTRRYDKCIDNYIEILGTSQRF